MARMAFRPIIVLENVGNFTKGELYEVSFEDDENIYLDDDEERGCYFSKENDRDLWRYASSEEIYSRDFAEIERFSQYQARARATAVYPEQGRLIGLLYVALGLSGEAGEVAEKTKKLLRDTNGQLNDKYLGEVRKELGDVLWYISNMCDELGFNLTSIAQENLEKLYSRKERDMLHGDGDNR